MRTITREDWNTFRAAPAHAGAIDGAFRRGLRPMLYSLQDGKCWDCGQDMSGWADEDGVNLCHLVGGFDRGKGYLDGNTPLGHRECNVAEFEAFDTVIPWEYIEPRAHRIFTGLRESRKSVIEHGAMVESARVARRAARVRAMLDEIGM